MTIRLDLSPDTALGILLALETSTAPYLSPEDADVLSTREYLGVLRDHWRSHAGEIRAAVQATRIESQQPGLFP